MKERIQEAIENREILTIKYHGGSQPGAIRKIEPRSIVGDKVWAYCYGAQKVKLFVMSKIEISSDEIPQATWNPALTHSPEKAAFYISLADLHSKKEQDFKVQGWHICLTNVSLSLHRTWKNGKPFKNADVLMEYEEYTADEVCHVTQTGDLEFQKENFRKKLRPWRVYAKNMNTRTFKYLDEAADVFLKQAQLLAPKPKNSEG